MKRILLLLVLAGLTGCTAIGPGSIARDRFDYSTNISQSWQKQMLLNIVKLRYADTPVFMDVTSVINQYSLEGSVDLRANFVPGADNSSLGGAGKYYDRPTITYKPLTGEKFTRSLMTPIRPATIMSLVQSGWPIDLVFWLNVKSINGLRNRSSTQLFAHSADPRFVALLKDMRRLQDSGAIGLRVNKLVAGHETLLIIRKEDHVDLADEKRAIHQALGLAPGLHEVRLAFGMLPLDDHEIALLTRSMLEIIAEMAAGVDIPAEHIAENRATPSSDISDEEAGLPKLIHIMSGTAKPEDTFAAIHYRDRWFWIDDRDISSKRMFSFLMILFSLAETGGDSGAPIVTIPAG